MRLPPAFAFGRASDKPRLKTHGSKVKLEIERVATPQPAVFTGVVRDEGGASLPGVTITVRDETATRVLTALTDVNGAFTVASLSDGLYRIEVTLAGLRPARIEHLQLKAGEVTHASVALRMDATVTVGELLIVPARNDGTSMRFTQDVINKLPF